MVKLVGVAGLKHSGKSALADIIKDLVPGAVSIAFADPIKAFAKEVFAFTDEQINGDAKDVPDPRYGKPPRASLTTLGTDWGRAFYPEVWVDLGLRRAKGLLRTTTTRYDPRDPQPAPLVLLTDVRFGNERDAIRREGGVVIRVVRPGCAPDGHPSEAQDFEADYTVDNDGTLDDLRAEAQRLVRWLEEQ